MEIAVFMNYEYNHGYTLATTTTLVAFTIAGRSPLQVRHSADQGSFRRYTQRQMKIARAISCCFVFALLSSNALAHHSYAAEFDRNAPMTIEGIVTEVWFKSPHVRYYIKVTDADENEVIWDTRGLTPVKLVRQGWMKDTIKVGDRIKMFGHTGRTNKAIMSILDVTLPDGRVLTSRSVAYDIKE